MAYKRKEKISLLLYYDYIEQFELLDDTQFRKLIYAMIEFDKNGKEEKLDKMTKMAFLPIKHRLIQDKKAWEDMCRKNSENVKKRWASDDTSVYDGIRAHTSGYQSIPKYTKNTDIERDIEIEKEIEREIERERNIIFNPPTLADIISFGHGKGIEEEYCKKFFNHYKATGWLNGNGQKIIDWKAVFENWILKDKKDEKLPEWFGKEIKRKESKLTDEEREWIESIK